MGQVTDNGEMVQKDFAIAYDRLYCLKDGYYEISWGTRTEVSTGSMAPLYVNAVRIGYLENNAGTGGTVSMDRQVQLKRGDVIQIKGRWSSAFFGNYFSIKRI